MYECFHCCTRSVIWDSDFTFEDCGYEGEGLVQFCHCENCGAEIEYRISFGDKDNDNNKENKNDNENRNYYRNT